MIAALAAVLTARDRWIAGMLLVDLGALAWWQGWFDHRGHRTTLYDDPADEQDADKQPDGKAPPLR